MGGAKYVELVRCEITRGVDVRQEIGFNVTVRGELKLPEMMLYFGGSSLWTGWADRSRRRHIRAVLKHPMSLEARCDRRTGGRRPLAGRSRRGRPVLLRGSSGTVFSGGR